MKLITDLFSYVLALSSDTCLILVMFLCFHKIFSRLPRKYFLPFWLLLAYKLLFSFQFTITIQKELLPINNDLQQLTLTIVENAANSKTFSLITILATIWFIGVLLFWIAIIYKYQRFDKRIADYPNLKNNIYLTTDHNTAFTTGFFKPRIYLPIIDAQSQDYMLQHELMHIKNHDNWWRLLALFILSIHFFNPLVIIAYRLFIKDLEMNCDEQLLQNVNPAHVAQYCRLLVRCAQSLDQWQPLCFTRNQKEVYDRVKNITSKKYSKTLTIIIIITIALCLSIFLFQFKQETNAKNTTPSTPSPAILETTIPSDDATDTQATTDDPTTTTFYAPVENLEITCGYYCFAGHLAEDITNSQDKHSAVYASAKGKVVIVDKTSDEGHYVIIDHGNDFYSLYANLGEVIVQKNDEVNAKQEIAKLGISGLSTGPHVHFAIKQIKDVEPSELLDHFNNEYPDDVIYKIDDLNIQQ